MTFVNVPVKSKRQPTTRQPSPQEVLPIFGELFSRSTIKKWLKESGVRMYWRLLTPLVILWGLIYQRLNSGCSCDAVVSYIYTGACDRLDQEYKNNLPLSMRLRSESTERICAGT